MYGVDETLATQDVIVTGVNLPANGEVTFTYTGTVGVKKADNAFTVATHGGLTTDVFAAVASIDTDVTVEVGYAKEGSGRAIVSPAVVAPSTTGAASAVTLTFTYTAVGEIPFPEEFRVQVPTGWTTEVALADYTVAHIRLRAEIPGRGL